MLAVSAPAGFGENECPLRVLVVQKRANGCFDASWLWSGGIFSRLSAFFGLEALLMTTPAAQGGSSPADGRRLAAN
jgi:hypothetical protein